MKPNKSRKSKRQRKQMKRRTRKGGGEKRKWPQTNQRSESTKYSKTPVFFPKNKMFTPISNINFENTRMNRSNKMNHINEESEENENRMNTE